MSGFHIIGVSAESGHGKDVVASWLAARFNLAVVSFADPLKRLCQQVFGFSDEQLWGPSEMRNRPILTDLTSAQVDLFWTTATIRFIGAQRAFAEEVYPSDSDRLEQALSEWFQGRKNASETSARTVLQTLGTECGRAVDKDIWLNYAHDRVIPAIRAGLQYHAKKGIDLPEYTLHGCREEDIPAYKAEIMSLITDWFRDPQAIAILPEGVKIEVLEAPFSGVVIPDHRFENEIDRTKKVGGRVLRIRRLSKVSKANVGIQGHASETEQRGVPDSAFDHAFEFEEGLPFVYGALGKYFSENPLKAI